MKGMDGKNLGALFHPLIISVDRVKDQILICVCEASDFICVPLSILFWFKIFELNAAERTERRGRFCAINRRHPSIARSTFMDTL